MNTYKVEKGIKIPNAPNAKNFPFDQLEVGDSFFVPIEDSALSTVKNATYPRNRGTNKKFSVRPVEGGTRVWRVE